MTDEERQQAIQEGRKIAFDKMNQVLEKKITECASAAVSLKEKGEKHRSEIADFTRHNLVNIREELKSVLRVG